jgi:hypothetical protein
MKYTRVLIAKVALRVASEDEVFWVEKCIKEGCGCAEEIKNIRALSSLPRTPFCVEDAAIIVIADQNKMSRFDEDHILSCERCAKIGQYIANMPFPAFTVQMKSLALRAG